MFVPGWICFPVEDTSVFAPKAQRRKDFSLKCTLYNPWNIHTSDIVKEVDQLCFHYKNWEGRNAGVIPWVIDGIIDSKKDLFVTALLSSVLFKIAPLLYVIMMDPCIHLLLLIQGWVTGATVLAGKPKLQPAQPLCPVYLLLHSSSHVCTRPQDSWNPDLIWGMRSSL